MAADLTYSQLKGTWLRAAKGTKYDSNTWASLMAAIAEAESAGDPTATNPTDNNGSQTSWGLWQISNGTHSQVAPNWADPVENAKLAIDKLNTQGLPAWGTYNTGAYKKFLSDKTAADGNVPAGPSASDTAAITSANEAQGACAWSVGWGGIPGTSWLQDLFGSGGNVASGEVCLVSKTQVRALLGVGLVVGGTVVTMAAVGWALRAANVLPGVVSTLAAVTPAGRLSALARP